jgi:hypothetical protein
MAIMSCRAEFINYQHNMALTYVGGTTASETGSTGTNLTISLTSLSGGSASASTEPDLEIKETVRIGKKQTLKMA